VPDREKVAACLLSNKHRISVACRTMLSHWHGWPARWHSNRRLPH